MTPDRGDGAGVNGLPTFESCRTPSAPDSHRTNQREDHRSQRNMDIDFYYIFLILDDSDVMGEKYIPIRIYINRESTDYDLSKEIHSFFDTVYENGSAVFRDTVRT